MKEIEARSEQAGVSTEKLMENAGLAVAKIARKELKRVNTSPVVILVGPGNNGGDGLVTARHLHAWGSYVLVYLCKNRKSDDPSLTSIRKRGIPIVNASDDHGLVRLKKALIVARLVVDAVLGTGSSRTITGKLREILTELANAKALNPKLRILALDLPSGLNADSGALDPVCPNADITATLAYPKAGLFKFPGADHIGQLKIADIGLPRNLDNNVQIELITKNLAKDILPQRPKSAHKGTFGRTLVIAGSKNYIGAAYLASQAAIRAGAGLVTLALPKSLQHTVASKSPELTYLALSESSPSVVSPESASAIIEILDNYNSLLIGCGMGQAVETLDFLERLLYSGKSLPPTVVDADGLNFLARETTWWKRFPGKAIVTPHPGEMARMAPGFRTDKQGQRFEDTAKYAKMWNKITVLKGAYTVVAFPNGRGLLSPFANPGLSSAGTGDILAGIISGLLSQKLGLENATILGIYVHGLAGEIVRNKLGDTGMIASDIITALPAAINSIRAGC